jgi:hypothetical protein
MGFVDEIKAAKARARKMPSRKKTAKKRTTKKRATKKRATKKRATKKRATKKRATKKRTTKKRTAAQLKALRLRNLAKARKARAKKRGKKTAKKRGKKTAKKRGKRPRAELIAAIRNEVAELRAAGIEPQPADLEVLAEKAGMTTDELARRVLRQPKARRTPKGEFLGRTGDLDWRIYREPGETAYHYGLRKKAMQAAMKHSVPADVIP